MRNLFALLCVGGVILVASSSPACGPKPQAGWPDVFPDPFAGYQRRYLQPVVNKEKTVYKQSAQYDWNGNDFRTATATLARDPEFKTAHTAEALKKAGAKEIKIGKKDAWIIPNDKQGLEGRDKIIVPLGEDKALIVEGIGAAHKAFPTELAAAFDAEKCAKALDKPPQTP
jgi:hypothetical protein